MATVNRYTQLSRAGYNPRTMQEMMMLPMMRRQQHDQSLAQASQMGLFEQQAAGVDRETVDRVKGEFEGSINEYVERLNKEGFNSETTQGILDLAKSRRKLEEDYLNPAHSNLQAMQAYQKQMMDSKINEGWSPQHAQQFAQEQLAGFKGTFGENGSRNSFSGAMLPKHVEVNKRLDEAIKLVGEDAVQGGLKQYDVYNYHDLMASTKITETTKNKILESVGLQLQNDAEFLNSYKTESRLNGLNEFDSKGNLKIGKFNKKGQFAPESQLGLMLYGKAAGAASREQSLVLHNIKDELGLHQAKKDLDAAKEGELAYAMLPDQQFAVYGGALSGTISKLGRPVETTRPLAPKSDSVRAQKEFVEATEQWRKQQESGSTVYTIDMMPEDSRNQYTEIFNKLEGSGIIPPGMDINSPEAGKAVNEHLAKYKDASYKNALIQPNASGLTENDTALMISSDNKKASEFLTNNIKAGLTKVWDEKGNVVQFEEDYWDKGKLEYLGYVSPNNYIDKLGTSGAKESVMPHMFLGPDGERYYASRQESETERPTFKAATLIKSATFEGGKQPELPVEHSIDPILQRVGVNKIVTSYNPLTKKYRVMIEKDGQVFFNPKEELDSKLFNNTMYELFK